MGRDPTETPLSNFGERRFISSRSNTCFVNPKTNEISLVHLKPSHLNRFLNEIDLLVFQKWPFIYVVWKATWYIARECMAISMKNPSEVEIRTPTTAAFYSFVLEHISILLYS